MMSIVLSGIPTTCWLSNSTIRPKADSKADPERVHCRRSPLGEKISSIFSGCKWGPESRAISTDDLFRAVERLAETGDDPLIFLEERVDVRAEFAGSRGARAVRTRIRGLAVETGVEPVRHRFLSDPGPGDLDLLIAGKLPAGREVPEPDPTGDARAGDGEPDPTEERLSALLEAVRAREGEATIRGRLVGLDQRVRIARPGRKVARDRRRGERIRVDVQVRSGPRVGSASAEWVLRPGRDTLDAQQLVAGAVDRARERLDARPAATGVRAAVFAPGAGGILVHEVIGHALEADTVRRQGSLLTSSAARFSSPEVVVADDPRRGRAAWQVDDEGETAGPVALVRDGAVVGRILDRRTARAAGVETTGHGRRASYLEPVLPRMGCTFLASGRHDSEEIVRATRCGIYVRRMEAASVDTCAGVATFRVTDADAIENGRIDHALAPFLLRATLNDTLSTLDHIASDLAFDTNVGTCLREGQPLVTSVGAPTFRLGVVTVHN